MMEKPFKVSGSNQTNNRGGILLTAILFLMFFSSIFFMLFEDYQITKSYYLSCKDLYVAKIMKEMFLDEYYRKESVSKSPVEFSTGNLTYTEGEQLQIKVIVGNQVFLFSEERREVQNQKNTNTDF